MTKPQGVILRGNKQSTAGTPVLYDKAETYDKSVPYYDAIDFVSIPPTAVVQLDKLSAIINQYE